MFARPSSARPPDPGCLVVAHRRHPLRKKPENDRYENPRRKIMTLMWNAEDCEEVQNSLFRGDTEPYDFMDMPRQQRFCMDAHSVLAEGREVGIATSRSFSFTFRQMMSHCVIDLDKSEVGTKVEAVWGGPDKRQKRIRATVAPSPYKKDNRRTDLKTAQTEVQAI
jgi:vanillate/3-O-methylgallate O-demethylase